MVEQHLNRMSNISPKISSVIKKVEENRIKQGEETFKLTRKFAKNYTS